jgi:hypothetical protein
MQLSLLKKKQKKKKNLIFNDEQNKPYTMVKFSTREVGQLTCYSVAGALIAALYKATYIYNHRRVPTMLTVEVEALEQDNRLMILLKILQDTVFTIDEIAFIRLVTSIDKLVFLHLNIMSGICGRDSGNIDFAHSQLRQIRKNLLRLRSQAEHELSARDIVDLSDLTTKIYKRVQEHFEGVVLLQE